jgi:predicted RNase H-like nuclease (RuvC/YqgF family)
MASINDFLEKERRRNMTAEERRYGDVASKFKGTQKEDDQFSKETEFFANMFNELLQGAEKDQVAGLKERHARLKLLRKAYKKASITDKELEVLDARSDALNKALADDTSFFICFA